MKEYLKMADVFDEPVDAVERHYGITNAIVELSSATLGDFVTLTHAQYAAHAINSHDELVAEVERLIGENEALMKCRMAAREFFNRTVASGSLVEISSSNKHAIDEANKASDWLEAELKKTVGYCK